MPAAAEISNGIFMNKRRRMRPSKLFEDDDKLKRIKIFVRPYPGGVPKHNPRINSLDDMRILNDPINGSWLVCIWRESPHYQEHDARTF